MDNNDDNKSYCSDNYTLDEILELFKLPKDFNEKLLNDNFMLFVRENNNICVNNPEFLRESYTTLTGTLNNNDDVPLPKRISIIKEYNKEKSEIEKTYDIPLIKGQVNPTLKNIQYRNLNIDSRFRPNIEGSSSDFIVDLNEPLKKVTRITLTNIEIKHSWYTFDEAYGTNYINFDVSNTGFITHSITLPNGNFTETELLTIINNSLSVINDLSAVSFQYIPYNGRVSITNNTGVPVRIEFYNDKTPLNSKVNNNLGWILGFHDITTVDYVSTIEYVVNDTESITSSSLIDVQGTRYFLLAIDDYNKNNINKGFINIYDYQKDFIKMPDYYTPDISLNNPTFLLNGNKSGLTLSQAKTIIEINNNRNKSNENRLNCINQSNVFARIQTCIKDRYQMLFISNNTLRYNSRSYFGPCDISRMRITIYNDYGQIMNLNGQDFSFMLNIEELYQY